MKKSLILFFLFVKLFVGFAQTPQAFNYQGVARNASNVVQANKTIKVRFTIRTGTATGTSLYSETRSVATNANGLFNVIIGSAGATNVTGNFANIDWTAASRWLQTEIDINNGTTFTNLGAVQMQSVPYALAANTADKIKLPMAASAANANTLMSLTNTTGTAIEGNGQGMSAVGVRGTTDQNIGILGIANGAGTAVYGHSALGFAGRFVAPATNTKSALEAEHKGNGVAVSASSVGGTAIRANATGQGVGVSATTDNNIGVLSIANNTGTAIFAQSMKGPTAKFETPATNSNTVVQGIHKGSGFGIIGSSVSGIGLAGYSTSKTGVLGTSSTEIGVKGSSTAFIGVQGISSSSVGVQGYSQTGTAGQFTAPVGAKAMEINGSLQILNTTYPHKPGAVLTSDNNGYATWQGPVAFKASGIPDGIPATNQDDYLILNATPTTAKFTTLNMNYGGGFDISKNQFTAPVSGIYHFNGSAMFDEQLVTMPTEFVRMQIVRRTPGGGKEVIASASRTNLTEIQNMTVSVDAPISQGDIVYIELLGYSPDFISKRIFDNSPYHKHVNWFSGHLITRL